MEGIEKERKHWGMYVVTCPHCKKEHDVDVYTAEILPLRIYVKESEDSG